MLNRRAFLGAALTAGAGRITPSFGQESQVEERPVNDVLASIEEKLKTLDVIGRTELRPVEGATKGLIQWQWSHFRPDAGVEWFPEIEETNADLFTAMLTVRDMPEGGLESLFHEGFVRGLDDQQMRVCQSDHRDIIRQQLTRVVPLTLSAIYPSEERIDEELNAEERLCRPTNHIIWTGREVRMSVLGRLGAGYALSTQRDVALLPAEDPDIDERAERAERRGRRGDYERWVMTERDRYFVECARLSTRRLVHLLVGKNHDLTDDIAASNEMYLTQLSHLTVTVAALEERYGENVSAVLPERPVLRSV